MNHPIILACLRIKKDKWFTIMDVQAQTQYSRSTVRHRLDDLAAVGALVRSTEGHALRFQLADKALLLAIRDGKAPEPWSAFAKSRPKPEHVAVPLLATVLGYTSDRLPTGTRRLIQRESGYAHNPDLQPRAGNIQSISSLERIC